MLKKFIFIGLATVCLNSSTLVYGVETKPAENETAEVEEIQKEPVSIKLTYASDKSVFKLGERGELTVGDIYGVKSEGTFEAIKTDFVELKADGRFTTLKTGETTLSATFTLSEKSLAEIKQAYLLASGKTALSQDDIEIVYEPVQSEIPIEIQAIKKEEIQKEKADVQKKPVTIKLTYVSDKTKFALGETGQLRVKDIYGVKPEGSFNEATTDFVAIKADGSFTTLKAGETTLSATFTLSEKSLAEIKQAYLLASDEKKLSVDDIEIVYEPVQSEIPITIRKIDLAFTRTYFSDKPTYILGETGQLRVKDIYGVKLEGTFKEKKNDFVDVKADGSFETLKVGKTTLLPNFTISEKSLTEIKQAYLVESGKTHLSVDDINILFAMNQPIIEIEIVAKGNDDRNDRRDNNNGNDKQLPKTSENNEHNLIILGLSTVLMVLYFSTKRGKYYENFKKNK